MAVSITTAAPTEEISSFVEFIPMVLGMSLIQPSSLQAVRIGTANSLEYLDSIKPS
jgi:hypothetical protein